jgi:3-methyladenine DNA glycosylase/8-oxoguanine DNA glycosylase
MNQVLPRPNHYDFWGTLRFSRFGIGDPTTRLTNNTFNQARWYPSGPATLRLTLRQDTIELDAFGPGARDAAGSATRLLGITDIPPQLIGHSAAERISQMHRGIRLSRCASFSAQLVTVILQQRIEWQQAARQWRRLCKAAGDPAPCGDLTLPPSFERLRDLTLLEFRKLNISEQQAKTIKEVGRIWKRIDGWAETSTQELRTRLSYVPGIGPWTTEMTLALYWAEADAVPLGDYALPHTVAYALTGRHRSDDKEMLDLLEPYRPHRGRLVRWIMGSNIAPPRRSSKTRQRRGY